MSRPIRGHWRTLAQATLVLVHPHKLRVTEAGDEPLPTDFGLVAATSLERIPWEEITITVPPLELQRAVSERRGLTDRVRLIDAVT